jgi:hypothetical protein
MKQSIPVLVLVCSAAAGCGLIPEKVSRDDPRVKLMLEATSRVDRQALGFTPISPDATIRLELGQRQGYDAMLHIGGKTSRTIAFRSVGSVYEWIGEQEIFEGPRKYKTTDGEFQESITLNYDKVPISGFPVNQLSVGYSGEDPALTWPRQLSLEDVRPILNRWGY